MDAWHFAARHPAYREYLASFGGSLEASLNPANGLASAASITIIPLYEN
jgi:hypothetical protein